MRIFGKFILSFCCCLLLTLSTFGADNRPLYSDNYIHRFEVCGPFNENYFYFIKTNGKHLTLKSKESIIGIRGGKCTTRSTIYLKAYERKPIGVINCAFDEEQRQYLSSKMKTAKNSPLDEKAYRQTYAKYLYNNEICKITDYSD